MCKEQSYTWHMVRNKKRLFGEQNLSTLGDVSLISSEKLHVFLNNHPLKDFLKLGDHSPEIQNSVKFVAKLQTNVVHVHLRYLNELLPASPKFDIFVFLDMDLCINGNAVLKFWLSTVCAILRVTHM